MTDKKPTDNEIVKALNTALGMEHISIYCANSKNEVQTIRVIDIIDLINRLQAEIERLRKKCENTQIGYNFAQDDIKTLKKDKYKLQKALNQSEDYRVIAKAEAYKEFLPLLEKFRNEVLDKFIIMCDGNVYNKLNLMSMVDTIDCIYDKHTDNLLKELVGED